MYTEGTREFTVVTTTVEANLVAQVVGWLIERNGWRGTASVCHDNDSKVCAPLRACSEANKTRSVFKLRNLKTSYSSLFSLGHPSNYSIGCVYGAFTSTALCVNKVCFILTWRDFCAWCRGLTAFSRTAHRGGCQEKIQCSYTWQMWGWSGMPREETCFVLYKFRWMLPLGWCS